LSGGAPATDRAAPADLARAFVLAPRAVPLLIFAAVASLAALLGLLLIVAGVALGAGPAAAAVGALLVLVFGGIGVLVLRAASPRRNSLRLDREGLTIRRLMEEVRYDWKDIERIETLAAVRGPCVVLKLGPNAMTPAVQRWIKNSTSIGDMMPHGGHAEWLTGGYGLAPERLAALLESWRTAALVADREAALSAAARRA